MNVETILSTVCWFEAFLAEASASTAHELERRYRPGRIRRREDGCGISTSGLFARYARGDSAPSRSNKEWSSGISPEAHLWIVHALWNVMRLPAIERWTALNTLQLHCRVFEQFYPEDGYLRPRPLSGRLLDSLVVQGDADAVAALLVRLPEAPLEVAEAAAQCLVFALVNRPLRAVRTLLIARLRQLFLDTAHDRSGTRLALDRYNFEQLGDDVAAALSSAGWPEKHAYRPVVRRKLLREILSGHVDEQLACALVVPKRHADGTIEDLCGRAPLAPRAIEIESGIGSAVRMRRFGKRARRVLRTELGPYWVAPQDEG